MQQQDLGQVSPNSDAPTPSGKIIQAAQRTAKEIEPTEEIEILRVSTLPELPKELHGGPEKAKSGFGASFLHTIKESERSVYQKMEQELSFDEYLDHLYADPKRYVRNSAGYTVACMEAFGVEEKVIMGKKVLDFVGLRTGSWQPENMEHKKELVGQELPTYDFYLAMKQAAKQEFPDEIYVFHGKPGSGKTRFGEMLEAGLEHFSRYTPEGAKQVLTFVFPDEADFRHKTSGFGFGAQAGDGAVGEKSEYGGYRIRASMNTDPVFLISGDRPDANRPSPREMLYEKLVENGKIDDEFPKNYLLSGQLDSTSRSIYEALLKHYDGDAEAVIRNHVRVERWSLSSQVGRGLVSIRPNPDRGSEVEDMYPSHPLHGPGTPEQLAPSERDIQLVHGIIPNANRGHVHFCDMLRDNERDRSPTDLSRLDYLLETIEGGKLQINSHRSPSLYREEKIDVVFRADTNDEHIIQKRQGAGWEAFKQRCHFIVVPCIRRFLEEARAHRTKLEQQLGDDRQAAPHSLETLALFATATRLMNPNSSYYQKFHEDLPAVVKSMTVVEKALLLQGRSKENPDRDLNILREDSNKLTSDKISLLRRNIEHIADEHMQGVGETRFALYDGGIGISTRETGKLLKQILRFKPNEDLTVLEVCEVLEQRLKGGFKYDEEVQQTKEQLRQELVTELARQEGKSLASLKDGNNYQLKQIVEKADEKLKELYPIPSAKDIVDQVKTYAKRKIQNDISSALGLINEVSSEFVLKRYINHVVSYNTRGQFQVRREYRMSSQSDGQADEAIMEEFEKSILKQTNYYDSTRKARLAIGEAIGAWQLNNEGKSFQDNVETIFPDMMNDIRKAHKEARQKVLTEFVEDTQRYLASPELLKEHMLDQGNRQRAMEWEKNVATLEKIGYPRSSLGKHVVWAFGSSLGK